MAARNPVRARRRALAVLASIAGLGLPGCGERAPADAGPEGGAKVTEATPGGALLDGPWIDRRAVASLPAEGPDLVDEAQARGLEYVNRSGEPGKPTVLEANGAGVALLDLGADGDPDAVFGQGLARLADVVQGGAALEVFENDGAGRFTSAEAPAARAWWTGLAAGDVDGDGDQDLVAGAFGALWLFAQREGRLAAFSAAPGGGLMADGAPEGRWIEPGAERAVGLAPPWFHTSLALLDAELDGDLDLYAGRYVDLDPLDPPRGELGEGALAIPCWWKGMEVYCGPRGLPPQADVFLAGDGAGAFEDRSAVWLPGHVPGYTLAVGAADADADGDSDLYVANDSMPNLMLVNEMRGAAGAFLDHALTAGVAVSPDGAPEAGMGVAFGDVNRDGRVDLAVTNFSDEPTRLFFAAERGFSDQSYRVGLSSETLRLLSWSAHLEDFDGDGWLELFTANGHVYPQADREGSGTRYAQAPTLWRLPPGRKVERVLPRRSDSALGVVRGARGSAVGDVDRDGAPDLVLAALDGPAILAMNRLAPKAARLVLVLEGDPAVASPDGRRSARDGHGARAVLVPAFAPKTPSLEEFALLKESQSAVGFQSSSSLEVFFATGALEHYQSLSILWPSGTREELGKGAMGRRLFVRQGQGIVRAEAL